MTNRLVWLLLSALIFLVAACGGSSGDDRSAQPAPATSPSVPASSTAPSGPPLLHPLPFRTGNPILDPIVAAAATADSAKLISLVELRSTPCTHRTGGDVTLPPCESDETEGKTVEVFNGSGCQPNLQRAAGTSDLIRSVAATPRALYGAYRSKGSDVTQVLMGTGTPTGWITFEVNQWGKLVGLSTNCGGQFRFDGPPAADIVAPPPA